MGWLAGWGYRKSHVINAQVGAGADYQIRIYVHSGSGSDSDDDVYLESHCTDFPNDIIFTDDDGITELSHWCEDLTADPAIFWVKVADSLEASSATIYIYYGKSGQSSSIDFDNTFIFGDPFDNAVLDVSRWTSVDGGPVYSINTTNKYLEITDMDANNWFEKGFHSKSLTLPSQYRIESAYGTSGFTMYCEAIHALMTKSIFSLHHTDWVDADYGIAFAYYSDSWADETSVGCAHGVGGNADYYQKRAGSQTRVIEIEKLGGNIEIFEDTISRVDEANAETPDRVHLGVGRYLSYGFATIRFYAFKIRKYVSPEPTHGAWGSEETPPVGAPSGSIIPLLRGIGLIDAIKPFKSRFPKFRPRTIV